MIIEDQEHDTDHDDERLVMEQENIQIQSVFSHVTLDREHIELPPEDTIAGFCAKLQVLKD
jgi:hypothetical protein